MDSNDLYSGVTATEVLANLSRTTTATSSAVDVSEYEGKLCFLLSAGAQTAGTNPTLTVKVTHCDTSDGQYADVTGAAFTQVSTVASTQILGIDKKALKKYVEVVATHGGTNTPTFPYGVAMLGRKKYV